MLALEHYTKVKGTLTGSSQALTKDINTLYVLVPDSRFPANMRKEQLSRRTIKGIFLVRKVQLMKDNQTLHSQFFSLDKGS